MLEATGTAPHTILCSGPDWLTCTSPRGDEASVLADVFEEKAQTDKRAALGRQTARWFGFEGHRVDHAFFGVRPQDVCLVLSGPCVAPLMQKAIIAAHNVSRFDLQVTTWTHGEEPHVGLDAYRAVRASRIQSGRVGGVSLVIAHPSGECCYINRRRSDCFGRIYDKATEAKLGTARTVWRYEVEYKRRMADRIARAWAKAPAAGPWSTSRVLEFFIAKGVPRASIPRAEQSISCEVAAPSRDTQTLRWLQTTIRVTLKRQIKAHGLPTIVDALGLNELVTINEEAPDEF